MSRFPGVDFLDLDALLTDEQRLVRDTVRAWVEDRVKPIIEECHREARTPLELVPEMGELNFFGSTLSDYGLPGLDN
ncbi:MAG TPA: acyl-CoA dehydrogenase family protein, partial [Thermoanaerobaculia bacterium]|nr:acyl-CoA dehydrogenase family protein [Thermoanaerobaculia bacterium]